MVEKLDIHNVQENFDYYMKRLDKSKMSVHQIKQIKRFVTEAQIGKNSTTRVGKHRLVANLASFFRLHEYFKKDFDKLTDKEVEKFYQDIEANRIKKKNGDPYKNGSKDELIRNLKRYLKWALDTNVYQKKAGWLKEYEDVPELPAITMKEAEKLAKGMKFLRDRALTMFLADSGCRIEEALNLKISQIEKKTKDDGDEFYIVDVKVSKTLPRRISVPIASAILTEWLAEHPAILDKEAYLFPVTYDGYRKTLRQTGKKILGRVITPHLLRHSSATHYCKVINNPYKFCYRYGWTMGSRMSRRYIDRTLLGEEAQEELDNLVKSNKVEELTKEFDKYKNENKPLLEMAHVLLQTLKNNKATLKNIPKQDQERLQRLFAG
jgi:integrase